MLILPYFSASAGAQNTGLPQGVPVYQSPFDPAGCGCTSPLCLLTNFNVVISGQNAIYNTQRPSDSDGDNDTVKDDLRYAHFESDDTGASDSSRSSSGSSGSSEGRVKPAGEK